MKASPRRPAADYVLPLRWSDDSAFEELTAYLRRLSAHVRVIIVDDSPQPLFAAHARAWGDIADHLPPDPDLDFANGKVTNVITGMRRTSADHIVLADDDVRYDLDGLEAMLRLLDHADLVRPQNYFAPLPWHARWDTARTLVNRCFGADHPGTIGIRRTIFKDMGGYDGDVLFENLELMRTVHAHGGTERRALDLYVRRTPPDTRRFWNQRVRQAYDELARPARMTVFLSVVPALTYAAIRHRPAIVVGAAITVTVAEIGRRRAGGAHVFPLSSSFLAPLWLLERGLCSWIALAARARGGISYAGRRIVVSAHSVRTLKRRGDRFR